MSFRTLQAGSKLGGLLTRKRLCDRAMGQQSRRFQDLGQ
jgi:hypothetical protein